MSIRTHVDSLGNRKLLVNFYTSVTMLFYELDINGQEFVDQFVDEYIQHAFDELGTKSGVFLQTSFSRRKIDKYFQKSRKATPFQDNYYRTIVFELEQLSKELPDGIIPIYEGPKSYKKIANKVIEASKVITAKSLLESMIKRKIVEYHDENHIKFISAVQSGIDNTPDRVIDVFCLTTERLISTLIHNYKAPDLDSTRFQLTINTIHIEEKHHKEVTDLVREKLRKLMREIVEIHEQYEVKTEIDKRRVENANIELGTSAFIYINKRNNYEKE